MSTTVFFEAHTPPGGNNQKGQTSFSCFVAAGISLADTFMNPGTPPIPIVLISAASPGVITTAVAHNLTTGDHVMISGSDCAPTVDGDRTVTVTGATTFTAAVNTTGAGKSGSVLATQIGCTADKQRSIFITAAAGATAGIPSGWYERVDSTKFRRVGA